MAELGARVLRVDLRWDLVALRRPAVARDPADPAYDWRQYDRIVAAARRSRVSILFTVWGTPAWAADQSVRGSDRFPKAESFRARPADPRDFGAFGAAAAARYAPRGVRLWEAWNEPNIPLFLRPQYRRVGGRWVPASPAVYSRMLSAFYREVKRVDLRAQIGGAVTAPVGDQCPSDCASSPDARITPVAFLRELAAPGNRPPMDVYSHHPYPLTGPREESFDGASYVDLYNLDRLEAALDRTYLRDKRLWLTELGFATRPVREYPTYFSEPTQARYLVDAYRRVRANPRVALLTWFLLQDNPSWSSGLLRQDGRRKPAWRAFALPAAAATQKPVARGRRVRVVGQVRVARAPTMVALQRHDGDSWRTLRRVRTSADGSFTASLRPLSTAAYRARWAGVARVGAKTTSVSPSFVIQVRS
jgi:hypothetical protein